MNIKKIVFCSIFLSMTLKSSEYQLDELPFIRQANQWIETFVYSYDNGFLIPLEDVHVIANLIFFSYYRSKITLDAQESGIEALNSIWQSYENIIKTRRNPSLNIDHTIELEEQLKLVTTFCTLAHQHRNVGSTYANIAEIAVNGNALYSALAHKGVEQMRSAARAVVAQGLIDVKNLLGELYYVSRDYSDELRNDIHRGCSFKPVLNFVDYLWTYIPQLAMSSFVEADKYNYKISKESWDVVQSIQKVSYHTWRVIEQARASFYKALYIKLYEVIEKEQMPEKYLTIMSETTDKKQLQLLPTPNQLP